jgi:hypothetical protein
MKRDPWSWPSWAERQKKSHGPKGDEGRERVSAAQKLRREKQHQLQRRGKRHQRLQVLRLMPLRARQTRFLLQAGRVAALEHQMGARRL